MPDSDHVLLTEAKCPACGAPIAVPDGVGGVVCSYCGASIRIGRGGSGRPGPVPSGIEPDGTIRDRATGIGLFRVAVPDGWDCVSEDVTQTASSSQPLIPHAILRGDGGAMADVSAGDAGETLDATMSAIMGMYGANIAGADRTNYAEMPDPFVVEQRLAMSKADEAGLTIREVGRCEAPSAGRLERLRRETADRMRDLAARLGSLPVSDTMCAEVIRTYQAEANGEPWGMATVVRLVATRFGGMGDISDQVSGMLGGIAGMMRGVVGGGTMPPVTGQPPSPDRGGPGRGRLRSAGEFVMGGGLIGKMMRERQAEQQAWQASPAPSPMWAERGAAAPDDGFEDWDPQDRSPAAGWGDGPHPSDCEDASGGTPTGDATEADGGITWCIPEIAWFRHGSVAWEVPIMIVLIAPMSQFRQEYEGMFLPLLDAIEIHPDVLSHKVAVMMEQSGQTQQAAGMFDMRNRQLTQATLSAARQRNAAFQAYNDSVSAARDARQASFRAASNAQFRSGAEAGGAGDFSEAIRGVNTFVTSDGREVELSVSSEVAYEDKSGDVIGGPRGFDPGADWEQIPRR